MSKLVIRNAKLVTMTADGIVQADLFIEDGKIAAIGKDLKVEKGCPEMNGRGRMLTPGFIDAHSHLGMEEDAIGFEGADGNEATAPVTSWVRGLDGYNPMDKTVREALEGGVTLVSTGPGSANVIGGSFFAVKTYGTCVDDAMVKDPVAMKCAFGENPKRVYSSRKVSPSTRLGTAAVMREALVQAFDYARKIEQAKMDEKPLPERNLKLEALLPVVRGEIPLKAHAHRADDIFTSIRIAKEFGVKLTLDHCTEGHLIAKHLGRAGHAAIIGPSFGHRSKFELKNKSFTTPAVLQKAGVKIAICTDSPVLPQSSLGLLAGMAVAAGLDEMDAFKAITINAAEIIGVADRFGSLEIGKDADLAIWSKHPFANGSKPSHVFIDGVCVVGA